MELRKSYKSLTYNDIEKVEAELEIKLPQDYKSFLVKHNGGQPKDGIKFMKKDHTDDIAWDFPINVFFGIDENDTSYELLTMYAIFCDRMPSQLIPIADDGIGNKICIGIHGEYFGKVYLWKFDGENKEDEEPTFDNIDMLAENFEEFTNHLK